MTKFIKIPLILSTIVLASCVNQNTKIAENIMPTTNACAKLNLLKNDYHNDFVQMKDIKTGGRSTNVWRAKYQLFGENCQVFSWGGEKSTYSCRLVAPDEATAQKYYQNAKKVTQQCLGENWELTESKRKHDEGMKADFANIQSAEAENVVFSTHLVPTSGIFSTKWTLFYYVGNNAPINNQSH